MRIVELSIRRRVTVAMVAVAVTLFGVVSFSRLPIHLLPDLTYPTLTLETRVPGAAPAEVETLVTRPLEEAVGVVGGVQRLTSITRPGLSQVTLEFGWGRDMNFAALDVRQKVDLVRLADDAEDPVLLRFDPSNDPIQRLYLTGDDLYRLRWIGDEVIKKDLESIEGLAAVQVDGGYEEEIHVSVDEGTLALLGLDLTEVRERLAAENIDQAGGSLYEREARYLVRSRNELRDLDDVRAIVLRRDRERPITLGDVATVDRGHRRREVITRFDGDEAVSLALYKEGDANTVQVAAAVERRLEALREELPAGIALEVGADQSRFITASIREVLSNAAIGGLIAVLVLLLFLKDVRATLVVGLSIPLSVVATFFLMDRTGTSLNVMSLGGLALGIGMLVDNAIVVLEAIYKRREMGLSAFEAARQGASEVGTAVVASTLTTVAVFLPVVFLEGVAAQLFRDQALTVSFSLLASLAVSLTLIPMLAAVLGTGQPAEREGVAGETGEDRPLGRVGRGVARVLRGGRRLVGGAGGFVASVFRPVGRGFDSALDVFERGYPRLLGWALRRRAVVIAAALLALVGTALLVPRLGVDLVPTLSQGEFGVRVELAEGTPLEATDRFLAVAHEVLAADERVAAHASTAGGAGLSLASTGTEGENVARLAVRLVPEADAEAEREITGALRQRLMAAGAADLQIERPSVFTVRTPLEIELYGEDQDELRSASEALLAPLAAIPGVVDLEASALGANPELQVRFDRDQLAALDLDVLAVAQGVRAKLQGDVATRFTEGDREIDVRVRAAAPGEMSTDEVADLIVAHRRSGGTRMVSERTEAGYYIEREVASGPGESVPIRLRTIATVTPASGPGEIHRLGQRRAAVISGDVVGRDMASIATDVRAAIAATPLPLGVTATLGGQHDEMARSLRQMLMALALAAFLVYLVMASQFESFLHPFVILLTLPLAAVGAVGALAVTGRSLDVVALIGMVMLAGIVVNNAIVLVDAVNQLRRDEGLDVAAALVEAGRRRLRPILMTTATTVLGLAPMALGLGEGAELRAPLAITVIGGLSVATLLTLVVVPVVYSLFARPLPQLDGERTDGASTGLDADTQVIEPVPGSGAEPVRA